MAQRFQQIGLILNQGQFLGSAPAFELALTLQSQRNRERSFNIDEASTWMIASKLCALWTTVFGETFCNVASAADVEGVVRASEDVDKGGSADGRWRFSRWEVGKIVAVGHSKVGLLLNK
jgi:hypothetical protein